MFEREEITVSNQHTGLRVLAFVLAVVLAMGAFSYGLTSMGHKEPGYYEIEAPRSEDASLYANGFTLIYYFDGESTDIKERMNALQDLYSSVLMRSYKLLDSENTYDGFVNLASLNQTLGEPMTVSQELLSVLKDAAQKTEENRGFHLFAGAMQEEWESILTLDDISEFVPTRNEDMAQRIQSLAEKTRDLSQFSLEILDEGAGKLRFHVDNAYLAFLKENDYSANVLNLGMLKDAYRMELIVNALVEQGYCDGYLYTDSGLTVNLPEHDEGAYAVYAPAESAAEVCAAISGTPGSAVSTICTFPMEGKHFQYHQLDDQFFHPYFRVEDGSIPQVLESVTSVSASGQVVECCYENLILLSQTSREEVLLQPVSECLRLIRFRHDPVLYASDVTAVQVTEGYEMQPF